MHLEALPTKQQELWPKLRLFSEFYLAGGTALALQIGHRISVDFDLFSNAPIAETLLSTVEEIFNDSKIEVTINNSDQLTAFINDVNITFLYYPFPVVEPRLDLGGLQALSIPELIATKAYTIGRRGQMKDYIDVYYGLIEKHATLQGTIALAKQKYQEKFNSRLFLEQLLYTEDITETEIQFLKPPVTLTQLKAFFEEEIKSLQL